MSRYRPTEASVPGYLEARSHDDDPSVASFPSVASNTQATPAAITTSAKEDINVGGSSAQMGIIIGTLIAFGVILFSLFLLYRKKSDQSISPLAWWQERRNAAVPAELNIFDPMAARGADSDDRSTSQDMCDEKLNESQQNLIPNATGPQQKQSIMQKMQQALPGVFGALPLKAKQRAGAADMEKGQTRNSTEDGSSRFNDVCMSGDDWSRRPTSAADISIQTESSMALHPAVSRIKSQKKTELRPGISAFSWSTTAPTPAPPSHLNMSENPLPPLPSTSASRRDTTLSDMTEDSGPTRHMSLNSWVTNMQTRQEKREQRSQQKAIKRTEAEAASELKAPQPVANPNARKYTSNDGGSIRLSDMTIDSNSKTPALETATMAWQVRDGPGQVEVPPMPQSASRSHNQGLGLQDQNYGYGEQDQRSHEEPDPQQEQDTEEQQHPKEEQYLVEQQQHTQQEEHQQGEREYLQQGEYSDQAAYAQQHEQQGGYPDQAAYAQQYEQQEGQYPQMEGEYAEHTDYAPQYEQQGYDYSQQQDEGQEHDYSQQQEGQENDYSQQQEGQENDITQQYTQEQQEQYWQQYSQQQQEQYSQQYTQEELEQYAQQQYAQQQQEEQSPPEIQINSPSGVPTIQEEDWIPNVARYPSGSTDMSGHTQTQTEGQDQDQGQGQGQGRSGSQSKKQGGSEGKSKGQRQRPRRKR